jgi:hypothetical protein
MARTFAAKSLEYSGSCFFFGAVEADSREAGRLGAKAVFPAVNMDLYFTHSPTRRVSYLYPGLVSPLSMLVCNAADFYLRQ